MCSGNMAEWGVARRLLWKHKAVIVNELDVSRVLPILVRKGLFNYLEERDILSSPDARFRADLFVDRLSTKGPDAFGQFCRALESTHPSLLTRFLLQSTSSDNCGKFFIVMRWQTSLILETKCTLRFKSYCGLYILLFCVNNNTQTISHAP